MLSSAGETEQRGSSGREAVDAKPLPGCLSFAVVAGTRTAEKSAPLRMTARRSRGHVGPTSTQGANRVLRKACRPSLVPLAQDGPLRLRTFEPMRSGTGPHLATAELAARLMYLTTERSGAPVYNVHGRILGSGVRAEDQGGEDLARACPSNICLPRRTSHRDDRVWLSCWQYG